ARQRDEAIKKWAGSQGIAFHSYRDQCLFEKDEILNGSGKPYTVFTPYKNNVLASLDEFQLKSYPNPKYETSFLKIKNRETMPSLQDLGFARSSLALPPRKLSRRVLKNYAKTRDYPALIHGTTHLGVHLRFGTISIRQLARAG